MQFTVPVGDDGAGDKLDRIVRGFVVAANSGQKTIDVARREAKILRRFEAAGMSRDARTAQGFPETAWKKDATLVFDKPEYDLVCQYLRRAIEMPAFPVLEIEVALGALDWIESIKGQEPAPRD